MSRGSPKGQLVTRPFFFTTSENEKCCKEIKRQGMIKMTLDQAWPLSHLMLFSHFASLQTQIWLCLVEKLTLSHMKTRHCYKMTPAQAQRWLWEVAGARKGRTEELSMDPVCERSREFRIQDVKGGVRLCCIKCSFLHIAVKSHGI